MQTQITGLSAAEVEERRQRGEGGGSSRTITKTVGQIIRENVLTLFNLLNFAIAVLLFIVGAYSNMLFIAIILLNIFIGIFQEIKAKKLVDQLSILNRPQVTVLRDGRESVVETDEIVRDDVIVLESGRQICNDAVVLSGALEVNESLLTGESDAVIKEAGDGLLSGSSVISGKCYAKVTHVGSENYATSLAEEVKKEKKTESELLGSMKKVTRVTSFLIIPLGVVLFLEALVLRDSAFDTAVVSSAAALLGMLPKGLVLLISVSLANGVIRLSRQKILVQNIYSLETLAHVDVLCLDKTGTLTDGNMKVREVLYAGNEENVRGYAGEKIPAPSEAKRMLCSYLAASDDNNATMQALKKELTPKMSHVPAGKIPFSSKRKWGAVSFEGAGTIFVGAPERIMGKCHERAVQEMEQGYRVIAVGYSEFNWSDEARLPETIQPLYIITLEDTIRKNVKKTLEYFDRENVNVKIISGDHVKTVSMVAKKAGLKSWKNAVDMSELGDSADYDRICEEYSIFARVTPRQKQELVMALKRRGHHVAMTGDGVNDLLALREADCSIAVAEGSDASRQIAQVVLLESDFTHLPQVVLEGRKVINNVTRTAGVFFIKTIYSVLLSLFCLIVNIPFPFIPIQITLIDACMEAYPSFLTIFESDTTRIKGSFLKKAVGNAWPFAFAVTFMIVFAALFINFPEAQKQTIMYLLLILTTMAAVIKSCIPFSKLRTFICTTMVVGTFGALYLLPSLFEVAPVNREMLLYILLIFAMGMILLFVIMKVRHLVSAKD